MGHPPVSIELFPYQHEGAGVLADSDRFGLHDEMGVGKSAQVIRAADLIGAKRGIIVCPAFLRANWLGEFRKFAQGDYRVCKGSSIHDFLAWKRGRFNVLVTSYEMGTKWAHEVVKSGEVIDFVAIDEAHGLKNSETKRTRAILGDDLMGHNGLIQWAEHYWHVTGTPMANDPLDIFTFLKSVHAVGDISQMAFTKRYFTTVRGKFGSRQFPNDDMIPELQALIRNNSIRRTKKEAGLDLPPIFLTQFLVDGNTDDIIAMLREYPGLEKNIILALDQGGLSFLDAQHIGTLRRLIGEAKVIPYAHMIHAELVQSGDKRVVYGIHRDVLQTLHQHLNQLGIRAVLVQGGVSERDRMAAVHDFQQDPECRVFIGNIRAAGTGVTLTAACDIDILESDWSPAGNAQAIMRVHRIGQLRTVRGRFITLANSFDETVNKVVAEKTAAIAQIEGEAMHAAPLDVLDYHA